MAGIAVDEVVLAPVGLIGNDDDVAALGKRRWVSPFSSGKNFWMVVNTTPPESTASLARRSDRLDACTGGWRNSSWHREKVPKS